MPPVDLVILTLALWVLHGKNGAKSQWCPPLSKSSDTSASGNHVGQVAGKAAKQ